MSRLILYTYWRSSASYRVRIALNLKQLAFESRYINLLNQGGENWQDDYLHINPQGLVPSLLDGKLVLNQSLAIIEYLDECYPEYSLMPIQADARAYIKSLALIVTCEIHPLNNLQVLQYLNDKFLISSAAKNKWYQHWIEQGLQAFESQLQQHQAKHFCFANQPGLADVFLIPQLYNAHRFGCDLTRFPKLLEIEKNCLKMPAFIAASPEKQEDRVDPT